MFWIRYAVRVALLLCAAVAHAAVPQAERDALIALFNSTNGTNWVDRTGWGGAAGTECDWYGITCNDPDTAVIAIYLDDNNLAGPLPTQIGDFSQLTELHLGNNPITGTLPTQLGSLTSIEYLAIYQAPITGPIPESLGQLRKLRGLYLAATELSGSIPASLGDITTLEELALDTNQLEGEIPASFARLTALRILYLHNNKLTGPISNLGSLRELRELDLGNNRFSGAIPKEFGQLSNLTSLSLYMNQLTGTVPDELFSLANLDRLLLFSNQLEGTISPRYAELQNLRTLDIGSNRFTGSIPPQLGQLRNLVQLGLSTLQLTGPIPDSLGNLTNLEDLYLSDNQLTGTIPATLGNLKNLLYLYLFTNQLDGPIPGDLQRLTNLRQLLLGNNQFTGTIPPELMNLRNLTYLDLGGNRLRGTIPQTLGQLTALEYLSLNDNQLSGPLPAGFADFVNLVDARLENNLLTGPLPRLSGLKNLQILLLGNNEITGTIPPDIGDLSSLTVLSLSRNYFEGRIPREFGQLSRLEYVDLAVNALRGPVPDEVMNLTRLVDAHSDFAFNALYTTNPAVTEFLNRKQFSRDWESFQTVAPKNVRVSGQTATTVTLSWDRLGYPWDSGGYQVTVSTSLGGQAVTVQTTPDKTFSAFVVRDLKPQTNYFFTVQTVTYPDGYQKNLLVSDPAPTVSASTTPDVPSGPQIVVSTFPFGLVHSEGEGEDRSEDYFAITNVGDLPATVTFAREGAFFTLEPDTLTLQGGEEGWVALRSIVQPPGAYVGAVIISGDGVPPGLRVPVQFLSVLTPTGSVVAAAGSSRVDISASADVQIIPGTAQFTNHGNATLNGILVSDVAWLVPQLDLVVIAAGQTRDVTFQVDRSQRTDEEGTATGTLSLVYLQSGSISSKVAFNGSNASVSTATVTVVDTVKPPAAPGEIPPIGGGEIALFIPGVRHLPGANGSRQIADLSIANAFGADVLSGVRLFFTPETGETSQNSTMEAIAPNQGLNLADVVKSVFNGDAQTGTLQIRTNEVNRLRVSASLLNVTANSGTLGSSVPVFRSDRTAGPADRLVITGVRNNTTERPELYVQETSGQAANITIEFFAASGTRLGSIDESVPGFRLKRINTQIPADTLTIRIRHRDPSAGRVVAYVAITDVNSGDVWTVTDNWSRSAIRPSEPVLIPVAGSIHGMNESYFRTDLDVANTRETASLARLDYYPQRGVRMEKTLELAPRQTIALSDAIATFFNAPDSLGYLVITPEDGEVRVTSRIRATSGGSSPATSTGVAAVSLGDALRLGQSQVIGAVEIASRNTIAEKKPGTYRTNIGLVETGGAAVKVRATVFYADARAKALGPLTTLTFDLAPHESKLVSNLSTVLHAYSRGADLRNVQLHLDVIEGTGAVLIYSSSVENATGDSLLRAE